MSFDGTGSNDPDGSIVSYAWTFGDGASAAGPTAGHTYSSAGSYAAKLTVTDNRGASSSTTVSITATTNSTLVNAPSGLTASAPKPGKVTLRWTDNSNNEQGFYIERTRRARPALYA